MIRPICSFLLCILTAHGLMHSETRPCGSDAQSTIATDRPQVTASSIVVPCGSLQFENGFQTTDNSSQTTYDFPETSVRFGVARKTELRFTVPDYYWNSNTSSGIVNGFGDMGVGFKQQLGPIYGFDLSLIPSVTFPTGANAISSHGYDPTGQLPWAHALAKAWTVAGMFSVAWPTQEGKRNVTGQVSIYIDRQLSPPWDAYFEYAGSYPQRGGPQNSVDFGTSYKITPHQQLDFHAGFGLSAAAPDYTIGFGYSVRFQVIQHR